MQRPITLQTMGVRIETWIVPGTRLPATAGRGLRTSGDPSYRGFVAVETRMSEGCEFRIIPAGIAGIGELLAKLKELEGEAMLRPLGDVKAIRRHYMARLHRSGQDMPKLSIRRCRKANLKRRVASTAFLETCRLGEWLWQRGTWPSFWPV